MGRPVHQESGHCLPVPAALAIQGGSRRTTAVSYLPQGCNDSGGAMKTDHDSGLVAGSGVLAASSTVSQDSVERLLRSCLLHLPRRSVPPSWSRRDWLQEVEQVVALAIMRALDDFHPARGEEPGDFVFRLV